MRNIIKKSAILMLLLILSTQLSKAQYILKQADLQFELFNYTSAIEFYKAAYKKQKSLHVTERLAESYSLVQNYSEAENWYALLINMAEAKPEATLKYAEALRNNAKYEQAKAQFIAYSKKQSGISEAQQKLWIAFCDSAIYWMKNPKPHVITNEKHLNSSQSDWGAAMYNNRLVFASDRSATKSEQSTSRPFLRFSSWKSPSKTSYNWTGNGYLSLYSGTANPRSNTTDSIQLFPIKVGTDYHVGPASFSGDGKEVYFTLTRIPNKMEYEKAGKAKIATINTEIYFSKQDEQGIWLTPVSFKYNAVNEHSLGDPFITKDGKRLYFVSNKTGGQGGTDIYYVDRTNGEEWGEPINLRTINTTGNERTPSIGADGVFYFSSDGKVGMGGLDIYRAKLIGDQPSNVEQMGYPINSPQDDFAFISTGKTTGYFSSNRAGGLGSDDIYSYLTKEIEKPKPVYTLVGKVLDKESNEPIKAAIVELKLTGGETVKTTTDQGGHYQFSLAGESTYNVAATNSGYIKSMVEKVSTKGLSKTTELVQDLYLNKIVIGKAIKIDNIFYDFDKFNIRADAALELDKLVRTLTENPTIFIELGSHTDSRGNDAYNQRLSQNRANSAVAYIVSKGISKDRITAKGYGETMLVNHCANGVKCSAAEHQANRRTEFKIVKY